MSSSDVASDAATIVSAASSVDTTGSGCTNARLSIHGSRGRTQRIRAGSTPLRNSQTMASVAVLPEPTITYWLAASATEASSLIVTTRPSSATPNGGGDIAGIDGAR